MIDAVKGRDGCSKGAGSYARNVLQFIRSIFNWGTATAGRRKRYGLRRIPESRHQAVQAHRPKTIASAGAGRAREMKALWTAAGTLGDVYGPLVRLLMLTGGRRSEIAEARWSEFDPQLVEM